MLLLSISIAVATRCRVQLCIISVGAPLSAMATTPATATTAVAAAGAALLQLLRFRQRYLHLNYGFHHGHDIVDGNHDLWVARVTMPLGYEATTSGAAVAATILTYFRSLFPCHCCFTTSLLAVMNFVLMH